MNAKPEANKSRAIEYILSKKFGSDYISYSYASNSETRMLVDFMGNLVKEHLDIDDYIEKAKTCKNQEELSEHYDKSYISVLDAIRESLDLSDNDLYKKACNKLLEMSLERVMFEKTCFESANESPVLKEYMFFLDLIANEEIYFDIHQSETPNLTEIFWLMEYIPKTNWSDSEVLIPKSPLSFHREAYIQDRDSENWIDISEYSLVEKAKKYYREGEVYFHDMEFKKAILSYKEALREENSAYILNKIGEAYYKSGKVAKAVEYFEKSLKEGLGEKSIFMSIASDFEAEGKYKEAIKLYKKTIKWNKTEDFLIKKSLYKIGLCQHYLGDNEKALLSFNKGIKQFPEYQSNYHSKAYILKYLKRFDEVIPTYDIIVKLDPSHESYAQRGLLNANMNNYEDSIKDYTKAISLKKDSYYQGKYYMSRSSAYKRLGNIDKAFKDLEKAFELDSENVSICLDLIEMYITTNNSAKIIDRLPGFAKTTIDWGSRSQLMLFYYLKVLIEINQKLSIIDSLENIQELAEENLEHEWYFGHTDEWIEESNMSNEQKARAWDMTELVKTN